MPIEIKELHIRLTVNPQQAPGAGQGQSPAAAGATGSGDKNQLIAECVEQVLQILENKRER